MLSSAYLSTFVVIFKVKPTHRNKIRVFFSTRGPLTSNNFEFGVLNFEIVWCSYLLVLEFDASKKAEATEPYPENSLQVGRQRSATVFYALDWQLLFVSFLSIVGKTKEIQSQSQTRFGNSGNESSQSSHSFSTQ